MMKKINFRIIFWNKMFDKAAQSRLLHFMDWTYSSLIFTYLFWALTRVIMMCFGFDSPPKEKSKANHVFLFTVYLIWTNVDVNWPRVPFGTSRCFCFLILLSTSLCDWEISPSFFLKNFHRTQPKILIFYTKPSGKFPHLQCG